MGASLREGNKKQLSTHDTRLKLMMNIKGSDANSAMTICVVGGAGYIGSHMVKLLKSLSYNVIVIDDLSSGHRSSIPDTTIELGSILDTSFLNQCFSKYKFDGVIHFASSIQVGESVRDPGKYYTNNVTGSLNLLDAMVKANASYIIFSSTAAVFGSPKYVPIDESHPYSPLSPYGYSKLIVEQILRDYDTAHGLKSVALRYFNAAGAASDTTLGERHYPETHLIPLLLQQAAGRLPLFSVFGDDYDTPDGTCIRDYIHVEDLCRAHLLALNYLINDGQSTMFNLGNGVGHSVSEVIKAVEEVTEIKLKIAVEPRRVGDPSVLIADGNKAKTTLGWAPRWTELNDIISHAWQWERRYPWS
jgi:UDP-glucose 4-epimerase